jgi:hypothetical protein
VDRIGLHSGVGKFRRLKLPEGRAWVYESSATSLTAEIHDARKIVLALNTLNNAK